MLENLDSKVENNCENFSALSLFVLKEGLPDMTAVAVAVAPLMAVTPVGSRWLLELSPAWRTQKPHNLHHLANNNTMVANCI